MVIVEKHKEVLLYQDVNSFSNSVFAQQVPLVTNIQRQYTTVINTIVNPQSSVTINIPINLPYTIVNTVVYVQNLQINRISIDVNPTGLVLFQITSPIFTQITTYPNMTIPIYDHEEISEPVLFTGTVSISMQNLSPNTVNIWLTIEGLYSLYNLAQVNPFIYKPL
ncbi:hypothetical protein [Caldisphaera sp.]|uniref:hypothetical protein n=1 Tax=Caldisphaera sp. TaxID=2060322 RepID=UPI0025C62DB2|nr:hypothetical protein [Caldisphaera sp.]